MNPILPLAIIVWLIFGFIALLAIRAARRNWRQWKVRRRQPAILATDSDLIGIDALWPVSQHRWPIPYQSGPGAMSGVRLRAYARTTAQRQRSISLLSEVLIVIGSGLFGFQIPLFITSMLAYMEDSAERGELIYSDPTAFFISGFAALFSESSPLLTLSWLVLLTVGFQVRSLAADFAVASATYRQAADDAAVGRAVLAGPLEPRAALRPSWWTRLGLSSGRSPSADRQ